MTTFLHKVAAGPSAVAVLGRADRRIIQDTTPQTAIGKEALVDLVLHVVAQADWTQPGLDGRRGRSKSERGEVLLATLTYCYAWGIYSSAEIEAAVLRHRYNSELLNHYAVDRKAFMQFRRYNRDLIKSCLAQVLGALNTARFVTFMDAHDAEQRIERAVACDSMEGDE